MLLVAGHAASLVKPDLHPEHCSWGAQYWCSSAETADLCGKAEWCALNDWPYDVAQVGIHNRYVLFVHFVWFVLFA